MLILAEQEQLCEPTVGLMYICSRTRCSGVLSLGGLRLDTCQAEEKIKEAPRCMADR